jgi:hypothetical protein
LHVAHELALPWSTGHIKAFSLVNVVLPVNLVLDERNQMLVPCIETSDAIHKKVIDVRLPQIVNFLVKDPLIFAIYKIMLKTESRYLLQIFEVTKNEPF